MSDLVSRLKEAGKWIDAEACFTAADEITRLRDENERLRWTLHRISLASQNSMSTKTECGALARKALLNEELSVSNAKAAGSYSLHRIAWELAQTASGNAYHGNALRVAKDLPGLCDTDRALLDRYATGNQAGTDHVALCDLAIRINALGYEH